MRAVIATGFNTAPKLAELAVPEPGPGEVLVRIAAAGVNPFDWKVVEGALRGQVEHAFPMIMGSDGAGVVELVGSDVDRFVPGDRVFGQFMDIERGHGSYAEYAIAPAEGKLAPVPRNLPLDLAAALPTAGAAAQTFLTGTEVKAGQTLLVNGASGGVGQIAVQLAAAKGAHVIATAPSDVVELLRELGAEEVVDFVLAPTDEQVRTAHPDGLDAVIDLVSGPEQAEQVAALLKPGGVIVSSNTALDEAALREKGLRGRNMYADANPSVLENLAEAVRAGDLKVRIDHRASLSRAVRALERIRAGESRGKTVLEIQDL
ncbi:NADP-dependent oxidoreductase [Glycomyces salinus]|uniref:NADP-dependent oxidoreductase n=1 Tax=Glycomyces salinus TaxID=980294 RepID=UPI0018EB95FF|nr:NADP-dependent oxidoreductase [Glycomyces salinus]